MLIAGASLSAATGNYAIRDYFPLAADSQWILQDVDGDPADNEGFTWTVNGSGPQSVGAHSAWKIDTDAVVASDSREGDAQYWNLYSGQADLGLYAVYEKAGADRLAANQTIAFSQPLRFGAERMQVGWSATSAASASFRVTLFGFPMQLSGTVAATVTLVNHLDQLSTPLGIFYDVLVLTADVSGAETQSGSTLFQGPLFQATLFLARGVGLVRSTRTLNPASLQAQAIADGHLGGVTIVPPPPPVAQGLTLNVSGTETGENGASVTASLVLDTAPQGPVTVTLTCADPSEASLDAGTPTAVRVFTPTDWSLPQQVVITGVDDADWDGRQLYPVTLALDTADPEYAALDPAVWTLNLTNRDDEALDIGDYFVFPPGSRWRYQAFNEDSGPIAPAGAELTWSVEDAQPVLHGVPVTAIRTDTDDLTNPLNGTANLWSLDPAGNLLLHGLRLPVGFERDVEYLGSTYHAVVPAQTIEFASPLRVGSRAMVTHDALLSTTSADVQVTGLPLISALPVTIAARGELLGLRARKRTPLGVFTQVPLLLLTVSMEALGQTVQDQGGVLFLARGIGVVCQNAASEPQSAQGLALAGGTVGTTPIVADDPTDLVRSLTLTLQSGWNLVALPFRPGDPSPAALFGTAIVGPAWEWQTLGYVGVARLQAGHAYWVYRNPSAAPDDQPLAVTVRGTSAPADVRAVKIGWICAGITADSPAATLPLPLLSGTTPVCRLAWTWGPGGFQPRRELPAGAGAWLFIENPGVINLSPATPLGGD
jgi:hypothetical protein